MRTFALAVALSSTLAMAAAACSNATKHPPPAAECQPPDPCSSLPGSGVRIPSDGGTQDSGAVGDASSPADSSAHD